MNAPADLASPRLTASPATNSQRVALGDQVATPAVETQAATATTDGQVCWVGVQTSPYAPDQQVELLHLQAEAEALLLQIQAMHQRQHDDRVASVTPVA